MNPFFAKIRSSLRFRLVLGLLVMLLPLIAVGTVSIVSSQGMVAAIEQVVRTEQDELRPVMELQRLVLQAAMPPNDFLIVGSSDERIRFDHFVAEADAAFKALLGAKALEEREEHELIHAAMGEWEKARATGLAIFSEGSSSRGAAAGERMKVFDRHIDRVVEVLGLLYEEVLREVERHRAEARAVKRRDAMIMALIFLAAVATAGAASYVLSRSILDPLQSLQDGVCRFRDGDHSFRVVLDRGDEFGQLAKTMNLLASRVEYDSLTGVYSRPAFHQKLKNEVERSLRYGHTFSLLMLDLDHFKRVNDTYGHQSGDDVLRAVTMRLLKGLRSADTLARYGGEEFTLIMPETGAPAVRLVANRLREAVEAEPVVTSQGHVLSVTVSIGTAAFPQDARSEDDIIAAADAALLAAKETGRNRVVAFTPDMLGGHLHRQHHP